MKSEIIASALAEQPEPEMPVLKPKIPKVQTWQPNLARIGTSILLERTETQFLYGERGSLKTGICLHALIRHCYEDHAPGKVPPLAVMCTIVRSAATEGGAWDKLHSLYLPEWRRAIGLQYTEPQQDDTKQRYCFIGTRHGDWARVILKSIPHGESIRARIKGIEPSLFFFDEITEADDPDYYLIPSQSLRRPTGGPRFFICAGNPPPEGTEHWTWKVFCQRHGAPGEDGKPTIVDAAIPGPSGGLLHGTPDGVAVYHVPLVENVYWSDKEKADYRAKLMQEARLDPTAEDRLIKGIWTPRPRGEGYFKGFFHIATHVKPPDGLLKRQGILPVAGYPIIIGYDLGQVWSNGTFEQAIPLANGQVIWLTFDELDYFGQKTVYSNMARELVRKMLHWRGLALPSNQGKPYPFEFLHVADESALNQWRPGDGSYDALHFEKEFNRAAAVHGFRPTKLIGCPKPAGSIAARIMVLQSKLHQDEFFVSAQCPNTVGMLLNLESSKDDPDKPRRNKWIHKFDSVTYPMLYFGLLRGRALASSIGNTSGTRLIKCGSSS